MSMSQGSIYRQSLNSLECLKSNKGGEYAERLVDRLSRLTPVRRQISDKGWQHIGVSAEH